MNKKILLKYVFVYLPFVLGIGMYSFDIINLFSSLLLFVGGYVAIKNSLDYRKVKKINNDNVITLERKPINVRVDKMDTSKKKYVKSMNSENVVGIKRTRRYTRVRRIR